MIYWRCRCGKSEYWESGMPPQACQGCSECGTTLATHPDRHQDVIPHDWEPRYNPRTGAPDKRLCRRCHAIERVQVPE